LRGVGLDGAAPREGGDEQAKPGRDADDEQEVELAGRRLAIGQATRGVDQGVGEADDPGDVDRLPDRQDAGDDLDGIIDVESGLRVTRHRLPLSLALALVTPALGRP